MQPICILLREKNVFKHFFYLSVNFTGLNLAGKLDARISPTARVRLPPQLSFSTNFLFLFFNNLCTGLFLCCKRNNSFLLAYSSFRSDNYNKLVLNIRWQQRSPCNKHRKAATLSIFFSTRTERGGISLWLSCGCGTL